MIGICLPYSILVLLSTLVPGQHEIPKWIGLARPVWHPLEGGHLDMPPKNVRPPKQSQRDPDALFRETNRGKNLNTHGRINEVE